MSKKKKEPEVKDETVQELVWKDITFTCPVRGQVTQRVQVKVLKSRMLESKHMVRTNDPLIDDVSLSELAELDGDDDLISPNED